MIVFKFPQEMRQKKRKVLFCGYIEVTKNSVGNEMFSQVCLAYPCADV